MLDLRRNKSKKPFPCISEFRVGEPQTTVVLQGSWKERSQGGPGLYQTGNDANQVFVPDAAVQTSFM